MDLLRAKIPETAFYTWFINLELVEFRDDLIIIGTPNNFVLDYVEQHYKKVIENAVEEIMGSGIPVRFLNLDKACNTIPEDDILESDEITLAPDADLVSREPTQIDSRLSLNPNYTCENFVVGDCNQLAHAACVAVSESPNNNNFNPLILYGGTGLGKTHLLQAVAYFIRDAETARKVVYRTSEEFIQEYLAFLHKHKDSRSFYRVYHDTDVLLIDDIQFLAEKKSTQEEFYNIFNTLLQLNKQVIITSDRLPAEIKGLHTRLLSRFDTGLLANLQPPELETRLAILGKKHQNDANVCITEEVLSYVANSVTSNIRELEGTLVKLTAYASFTRMPITVQIAKQILGDTIRNVDKPVTIKKILKKVSSEFDVPVAYITSQTRKKNVTEPRQIAMYLARQLTDNSLHTIGLAFGRDYSTVIHSIKKVETLLEEDPQYSKLIENIKETVSNP
jgi:chromosomal replication initiator protein